jgi:hypothetical protein
MRRQPIFYLILALARDTGAMAWPEPRLRARTTRPGIHQRDVDKFRAPTFDGT